MISWSDAGITSSACGVDCCLKAEEKGEKR